jgi:hypothetical protein
VPEVQVSDGSQPATRFRTRFRQLVSDLRIVSEHVLLPNGIADNLPPVDQTFGNFGGNGEGSGGGAGGVAVQQLNETVRAGAFANRDATFARFVRSVKATPKTLNLIHIEIPHVPWVYLPTGQDYETHSPDLPLHHGQWATSQYAVDYAYLRHLLQTGFADKMVGDLIARMKKVGLWDKAIFMVVADHGVSFVANSQRRDPTRETVGNIAPVPLFVRAPGQRGGGVDDTHKCTTDVLPMLASLLKTQLPWRPYSCADDVHIAKFDGQPLTIPIGELLVKRKADLERMLHLFGTGSWARAYRFGPQPELIGKQATGLRRAARGSGSVALEDDFAAVNPTAAKVPVIVQGTTKGLRPGVPVAIAVNGRIAVTGETFAYMGATRVAATVPTSSLRPGRNSIEVLQMEGAGPSVKLASLGGVGL